MARRRWRIRHKLMLGLGLVVGILALLLAGTLKGLASYRATASGMDSKLSELREAHKLRVALTDLDAPSGTGGVPKRGIVDLRARLGNAREQLAAYEERLQMTLERHRDSDKGFREKHQVGGLQECFDDLEAAIMRAEKPQVHQGTGPYPSGSGKEIDGAINALLRAADDLQAAINEDLDQRIRTAKTDYKSALWIVGSTSLVGVVLMVSLLRFFYGWMFYPIRDLQQGAGQVAQGDFEHRIEVHSGDEIEDLAAAFNDMTDRLRELYGDLTHQVNERSRQLVRSERLASVGFLAAGVAHEINNPLASIAFCAEALEARLGGNSERGARNAEQGMNSSALRAPSSELEVISKYLRMIQDEAFRCKKITERLLEFSRSGERLRESADLVELVEAVMAVLEHHQDYKGKQIVLKPQGRVVARINTQEIKSVVLNLVVNALDSMEDGGTLTIRVRQRDGNAELEFADTGCGMTAEVLENIFEPFFTQSRTGKGTGLGLTISHRIVAQHGGGIEATSAGPGQGSTFTVRVPLQALENSDQPSAISDQPSAAKARAA